MNPSSTRSNDLRALLRSRFPGVFRHLKSAYRSVAVRGLYYLNVPMPVGSPVDARDQLPDLLRRLGLNGEGVEVGVYLGTFSKVILDGSRLRVLHSVDPWRHFDDGSYVDAANHPQAEHDRRYAQTMDLLRAYGERSRIWRMLSVEAAAHFEPNRLDFVYLDGNHSYSGVKADLEAWYPKIRRGGLFAGHDYIDGKLPEGDFGVRSAVNEFAAANGLKIFVTPEPAPTWYCFKR